MKTNPIQNVLKISVLGAIAMLGLVFLNGCSSLDTSPEASNRVHDHHIWVVDEQGKPTSLEGTWKMTAIKPPSALRPKIGDIHHFPDEDTEVAHFTFGGIYQAPDGKLWTKVKVVMKNSADFFFLERLERSDSREVLHIVEAVDDKGNFLEKYADDPSDAAHISHSIWVKQ